MYRCLVASLLVALATAQYAPYGSPYGYSNGFSNLGYNAYPQNQGFNGYSPYGPGFGGNNYYNQWYNEPENNPYYDYNWQPSVQCTSHYQCSPNQYCFDCDTCKDAARAQGYNPQTYCGSCSSGGYPNQANQPQSYGILASLYGVQAQFQTLGSCGPLENCATDADSIDGSCPASTIGDECQWDRDCAYGEVCWGANSCPPGAWCQWEDEKGTCEAPYGPASGPAGFPGYNQYGSQNQYQNQYYSSYYDNLYATANPYTNQYQYPGYNYNGLSNYNNYNNVYSSYYNTLGGAPMSAVGGSMLTPQLNSLFPQNTMFAPIATNVLTDNWLSPREADTSN